MSLLPDPDEAALPTASCARCERVVLCVLSASPAGELSWSCIHCDHPLDPQTGEHLSLFNLDGMGYDAGIPQPRRDHHGGCRGGQCGVRQPDPS
jgi:hypothetical protein